jgi:hypothetical protein
MQNKPNFQKAQMNVNSFITKDYEKRTLGKRGKNKPNSKPISERPKMNVTSFKTMNYEQRTMNDANKNKPKTNPISKPKKSWPQNHIAVIIKP